MRTLFTDTAEVVTPEDPLAQAVKVSRDAPPGGPVAVTAPLYVNTRTSKTSQGYEWNALFRIDNYADQGENTALYTKAHKFGRGATWAACFEARDITGKGGGGLYAAEFDLIGDGYQPGRNALKVMYGPQTAGASSKSDNGAIVHQMSPGDGSALINGYNVWMGLVDYSFASSARGCSALRASGTYSEAVVDASQARAALGALFGPGQRVKFISGTLDGNTTWYSGAFVPRIVGALEIMVDQTVLYVPVCCNRP